MHPALVAVSCSALPRCKPFIRMYVCVVSKQAQLYGYGDLNWAAFCAATHRLQRCHPPLPCVQDGLDRHPLSSIGAAHLKTHMVVDGNGGGQNHHTLRGKSTAAANLVASPRFVATTRSGRSHVF